MELGQDVFTRLIFGDAFRHRLVFLAFITLALDFGSAIGLSAGYFAGCIDAMSMRFTDAMLSIPVLPLMIVFAALDLNCFLIPWLFTQLRVYFFTFSQLCLILCMFIRFLVDERKNTTAPTYFLRMAVL